MFCIMWQGLWAVDARCMFPRARSKNIFHVDTRDQKSLSICHILLSGPNHVVCKYGCLGHVCTYADAKSIKHDLLFCLHDNRSFQFSFRGWSGQRRINAVHTVGINYPLSPAGASWGAISESCSFQCCLPDRSLNFSALEIITWGGDFPIYG